MTIVKNISLESQIKKLALDEGAVLVGICSADSIKDREFSDPNYLLPGAKSVISIAMNYTDEVVKKYLSKEDRHSLNLEEGLIVRKLKEIGEKIKILLEEQGYKANNCDLNFDYRNNKLNKAAYTAIKNLVELIDKDKDKSYQLTKAETKMLNNLKRLILPTIRKTSLHFIPELSHKCVAEAAGLGRIGWSGNLVTEKYGARVLLNSIITDANLEPDKTLEHNPCTGCKLCAGSCQGGLFSKDEQQIITIAGVQETIAKRNDETYCIAICSGMKGQNKFPEWSTWSPFGSVSLPSDDTIAGFVANMIAEAIEEGGEEAENMLKFIILNYKGLCKRDLDVDFLSCTCCQLVCGATNENKKESYNLLINSGCV